MSRSRSAQKRLAKSICEQLETRRLLATIGWSNRGNSSNDSDGFNALFGSGANAARFVCDRAIADWEDVIVNFNYNGGGNAFNLTIRATDIPDIADTEVTSQNNGKPTAATIRIDSVGTTHWVDPSPGDDAEFDDNITNAFTGYAQTPGITGVDLYETVAHELGHALGVNDTPGLTILNFLTDTGIDDPRDSTPGNLVAFNVNGGPVEATFTNADPAHLWAGPGNTTTNNAGLPWHSDALMNSGRVILPNERNLISDTEALILRDAYGYTIALPSTINNMLVNPNFTSDVLNVVGQPGTARDLITVQNSSVPGALQVKVETVGGGPSYSEIVPLSQTNTIVVSGNAGDDILRLENNGGKQTTFNGGDGNDFFDFAFGSRNLNNITGDTTLNGGNGNDNVYAYDNANAAAATFSVSSIRVDRPGWGGFFYANDLEGLALTTGTAANVVNVTSTYPNQPLVLNSAGGNDVVNLGAPATGVQLIRSDVQIQNDPAFTFLNINDSGDATSRNIVIDQWAGNFGAMAGLAPAYVTWDNADIQEIRLTTGGGNDNLSVLACSERLFLSSSGGEDNISLGTNASGMNQITGTVNVGPNAPFVLSNLTINDTGNATSRTAVWTPDGNGFVITGIAPQPLRYENVLQLNVRGGTGPNHFALGGITDDNISLDGGGGSAIDSMAVDDRAFPTALAYADVGPASITRGTGGIFNTTYTVAYAGIEAPLYYANNSTTAVNLYGSSSSIPAGQQMSVFCGSGSDTITLYLRNAQGGLSINGTLGVGGGGGTDTLVVNDSGSTSVNYQFLNLFGPGTTNIGGLGSANVGAGSDVENITVSAGSGDDSFTINSFQSGSGLTLRGNGGSDSVNWTPGSRNTVAGVTAISFFSFDGGDGHDYLNFFNDNNPSAWNYTRTNTMFSASRIGVTYFLNLNDPNVETLYATGGAGADQIVFQQVRSGGEAFIDGAGGNDSFVVGNAQRTQDIRGLVGIYTNGGTDSVTIDDRADTVGRTFHVGASSVGAGVGDDLFGPGGRLEFGGVNGTLMIRCGSGSDNAYVLPNPTTPITIELNGQGPGGGPESAVGDFVGLALVGATNPQHVPGAPGAGQYLFGNRAPVSYSGAETLDVDSVAPAVASSSFEYDLPRQAIRVRFSENVASSVTPSSITLTNLTSNQTINAANIAVGYDAATNTASFTFPGLVNGALPDGNYRLTLAAGAVSDLYGNPTTAPHTLNFFFLQADANHDGRVNLQDFNRLAGNFGHTNATFSQGDFNYDGVVNLRDFNLLAGRFGTALGPDGIGATGQRLNAGQLRGMLDDVLT